MWTYVQSTGDLFHGNEYIETGYSGKVPEGKNDPDKECIKNVGPIPRGGYNIGPEKSSPSPVTLILTADNPGYCNPARDGFLIHGDNSTGTASTGCIILSRRTRERIRDSNDNRLKVVRNSMRVSRITQRKFSEALGL